VSCPKVEGTDPVSEFTPREMCFTRVRFPREAGRDPVRPLWSRMREVSPVSVPRRGTAARLRLSLCEQRERQHEPVPAALYPLTGVVPKPGACSPTQQSAPGKPRGSKRAPRRVMGFGGGGGGGEGGGRGAGGGGGLGAQGGRKPNAVSEDRGGPVGTPTAGEA